MSVTLDRDHFAGRGGLVLRRRRWSGPDPMRAFAIVHGIAEHSARYDHVARFLAERGWRVHAFDQRGHGESEGPRNHVSRFEVYLDDIERFLELVRREEGDRPLVLLGHSMGGLEVACLLALRRPRLDAAVLSAPALSVGPGVSRLQRGLVRALSVVAPRLRLGRGFSAEALSRDPEVVRAYEADPLISPRVTSRLLVELLKRATRAVSCAPAIQVPLLIAHGEADPLCDVEGSRAFSGALPPGRGELVTYPGLLHEILNEPEWRQVLGDICAWLDKKLPAGAGS